MHAKQAVLVLSLIGYLSPDVSHSQELATGLVFMPPQEYNALRSAREIIRDAPMPGSVDLAEFFPPPQDQGQQGSCTGWAVAYTKAYHENLERITNGNNPVMYSPSFIYNQIKLNGCHSGSRIPDALNLIVQQGAVNIHEFVYNERECSLRPTARELGIAGRTRASSWGTVKRISDTLDTIMVQNYLIAGVPVIIGAEIHENFGKSYDDGVYKEIRGASRGGHAMVIIGFDSSKQAYKLINSWGDDWGDRGYGWVDYNTMRTMVREAYVVFDDSSESVSWRQYQQCLGAGNPRCCDHLSDDFSRRAKLCTHIPGLDRMANYRWCVSTGRDRCCDHLTSELIRDNRVQACGG